MCFYANVFGQETYLTIKWKNVKTLTEEKAAFVFPNAIQVIFLEKYFSIQVNNHEIVIKIFHISHNLTTVPIAKIISVKNAPEWVSMVSYLEK